MNNLGEKITIGEKKKNKIKAQEFWFSTERKPENIITVWMTSEQAEPHGPIKLAYTPEISQF